MSYVLTKIMMAFPSYDLEKLLHTSYKRVLQLFSLADKSSTMRKLEYSIGGAALHDTKIGQILQQVELTATVTDKAAMKSVMTDEAKIKAAEALRRMSEAKQNEG